MPHITFNKALGEKLMELLLTAYERKHGVHGYRPETHAPQHLFVPQGMVRGSLEWRQWLSRATASDYRTQSMQHYEKHALLQSAHPTLYTWQAATLLPGFVADVLRERGFSKWESMSEDLPTFASTLCHLFDDDPRNFYREGSIKDFLKLKHRLQREYRREMIPGFGPKISSLYAIYLEELGLVKIEDALPVDVWIQQIFRSTGIITHDDNVRSDVLENEIRLFLCDLCARRGWSRVSLSHALWFLGNRGCRDCYRRSEMQLACVLWHDCQGRASSVDYTRKGWWSPTRRPLRKGGSQVFLLQPTEAGSPQQPLFSEND